MIIKTFNRTENKYILDYNQFKEMQLLVAKHMILDGRYTIRNIYYDTEDHLLIKKSLAKPYFKEKLRLRGYGELDDTSMVFLEIKRKVNGRVYKRRSELRLDEAIEFIKTGELPVFKDYHNVQILKEIQVILMRYELKPDVMLFYDRVAYKDGDFRVTFDTKIRSSKLDLDITGKNSYFEFVNRDMVLLEVKSPGSIPIWFTEMLSQLKVYPSSYSKVGNDYVSRLNYNGGFQQCSNH